MFEDLMKRLEPLELTYAGTVRKQNIRTGEYINPEMFFLQYELSPWPPEFTMFSLS